MKIATSSYTCLRWTMSGLSQLYKTGRDPVRCDVESQQIMQALEENSLQQEQFEYASR